MKMSVTLKECQSKTKDDSWFILQTPWQGIVCRSPLNTILREYDIVDYDSMKFREYEDNNVMVKEYSCHCSVY